MSESPVRRMVLLVDPHEDTRDLYGNWFFSQGLDVVTTAMDDIAVAIAEAYQPDLVVTEFWAPGIDGLHLTQRLRVDAATRHIPILVLTTATDRDLLAQARAAGANVLPKLADFDRLLAQLSELLPQRSPIGASERRRQPISLARILGVPRTARPFES